MVMQRADFHRTEVLCKTDRGLVEVDSIRIVHHKHII